MQRGVASLEHLKFLPLEYSLQFSGVLKARIVSLMTNEKEDSGSWGGNIFINIILIYCI